ncbi:uncharacterized protein V1516DRAFT_677883 [Lipomyces oligophaga]|uniref:uncharacterized protein n=1 Tax=Lipomyces oligophaga TaxID=45792 RepID=UPI0034CE534B
MASDNTTTTFIAVIIIGIFLVRWLVSPSSSQAPSARNQAAGQTTAAGTSSNRTTSRAATGVFRRPRVVTDDMIEVVQSIAPQLSPVQIRYDLERTGSVEVTIDNILRQGTLPFPPDYVPEPIRPSPVSSSQPSSSPSSFSDLITRYNLETKIGPDGLPVEPKWDIAVDQQQNKPVSGPAGVHRSKWSQSREERQDMLKKRREEMILKARKRVQEQDQKEDKQP